MPNGDDHLDLQLTKQAVGQLGSKVDKILDSCERIEREHNRAARDRAVMEHRLSELDADLKAEVARGSARDSRISSVEQKVAAWGAAGGATGAGAVVAVLKALGLL